MSNIITNKNALSNILDLNLSLNSILRFLVNEITLKKNSIVNSASSARLNENFESGRRHDSANRFDEERKRSF